MSDGHSQYDELVASSPQGSVFARSWWFDAVVGPGRWRPNLVVESGSPVAAWPSAVRSTRWGPAYVHAPLTPYAGPLFRPSSARDGGRSEHATRIGQLLEQMSPYAHLEARCNPAFDYWTPLHWAGFSQTTHYTWRLTDLSDIEGTFAALRSNIRTDVKKARKLGITVEQATLEEFLPLHAQTFERQGIGQRKPPTALLQRIDAAAAARDARTILIARDADGQAHSGCYLVHDDRYAYYLLGGSDTTLRKSGAASLALWSAIEHTAQLGLGFDFEGSMLPNVERFVRAFGGEPVPYSFVRHTPSRPYRTEQAAKRTAKQLLRAAPARTG